LPRILPNSCCDWPAFGAEKMRSAVTRRAYPSRGNSFDCVFIGYGLRNFPDLKAPVQEIKRVTRAGGSIVSIDFFLPSNAVCARDLSCVLIRAGRRLGLAAYAVRAFTPIFQIHYGAFSPCGTFRRCSRTPDTCACDALVLLRGHWASTGQSRNKSKRSASVTKDPADPLLRCWHTDTKGRNARPDYDSPRSRRIFFFKRSKSASVNCFQISRSVTSRFHCQASSGNRATTEASLSPSASITRSANAAEAVG